MPRFITDRISVDAYGGVPSEGHNDGSPDVRRLENGDFVVVWHQYELNGGGHYRIF